MGTGAITQYIDVAQLVLYAFWIFFAGLIYYLLQENKREGYPLETDGNRPRVRVEGWPPMPAPKTFDLGGGQTVSVPNDQRSGQTLKAAPLHGHPGSPLVPTGDTPMLDGVGPGAWNDRADVPDLTTAGEPRLAPLRAVPEYSVVQHDTDPRGLPVVGCDGAVGGEVVDLWLDRTEIIFRYLELRVAGGERTVLLPMGFARIGDRQVKVDSITGSQFAAVPAIAQPAQVTRLEEEKIMGYYGAGALYAVPARQEPLL